MRVPHLLICRAGIFVQQCLGSQNLAVQAISALERLFFDKCLLDWMRILGGSQPFQRNDLSADDLRYGHYARPDCTVINQHGACAALPEAAPESGIV